MEGDGTTADHQMKSLLRMRIVTMTMIMTEIIITMIVMIINHNRITAVP